jgi:hypothetical protein
MCVSMSVCVLESADAHATARRWRSEDNLWESVLSFNCGIERSNSGCQIYITSTFAF